MATHTLTVSDDGTLTPDTLSVNPGDTVVVTSEPDAVLCVAPDHVFGEARYEIPAGHPLTLTVQPKAASSFEFMVQVGDLSASCTGTRGKVREGVGQVGGGPD